MKMDNSETTLLADFCKREIGLAEVKLGEEYGYGSLPLCVIDAVFSIGVRYESVRNVIKKYCMFFNINETAMDQQSLQDMIEAYECHGVDYFIKSIYSNRQRTSTKNGILKAEAVLRFASALNKYGVNLREDVSRVYEDLAFEATIRRIPGQSSGLSLRYFFMLSGNDEFVKPDRMIIRFLQYVLKRAVSIEEAQSLLTSVCRYLNQEFPQLSPRLLDHTIWNYERNKNAATEPTSDIDSSGNRLRVNIPPAPRTDFRSDSKYSFSNSDIIITDSNDFPSRDQYDRIFQEISECLHGILPKDLKTFADKTTHGNNWMVLKYPGRLPNCQYEMHFTSDRSKNHTLLFGPGDKTLLCCYYEGKQPEQWLQEIRLYRSEFESKLEQEIVIAPWSQKYMIIGFRLKQNEFGNIAEPYAKIFARFIQATYDKVSLVTEKFR
ncbi:MAG: hypothetical protein AB9903_36035 [Vulcanimicrobiota bacterium]